MIGVRTAGTWAGPPPCGSHHERRKRKKRRKGPTKRRRIHLTCQGSVRHVPRTRRSGRRCRRRGDQTRREQGCFVFTSIDAISSSTPDGVVRRPPCWSRAEGALSRRPRRSYPDWIPPSTKPPKRGGTLGPGHGLGSAGARPAADELGGLCSRLPRSSAIASSAIPSPTRPAGPRTSRSRAISRSRGRAARTPGCGPSSCARASSGRTCRRSTGASSWRPTSSTATRRTPRKGCRPSPSRRSRASRPPTSTPSASI